MRLGKNDPLQAKNRTILAFAHLNRTGGNTFNHILRYNYFLKSCVVRPLSKASGGIFCAEDMMKYVMVNPLINCIMGHTVRPYSNLREVFPNIRYITLLRDPIKRYISEYQHRERKHGRIPFEEFLRRDNRSNLQCKDIVGSRDVECGKAMLAERYLAVGILEEFDEFLIVLRNKLGPRFRIPSYNIVNVARDKKLNEDILEKYKDAISENNYLDCELYNYVKEVILPKQKASCGSDFEREVEELKSRKTNGKPPMAKGCIDYLIRKLYYNPVTSIIRILNGLPAKGLK